MFKNLFSLVCSFFVVGLLMGQGSSSIPENWFNLDYQNDNIYGVSTEKTYKTLLKDRTSNPVIVAVIDSGVEVDHEDLKDIIWVNPGEVPGNGIDDDRNGYIDDLHGWNFISNKNGENVDGETLEVTRLYADYRQRYADKNPLHLSGKEKKEYARYLKLKKDVEKNRYAALEHLEKIEKGHEGKMNGIAGIEEKLGENALSQENLEALDTGNDEMLTEGKNLLLNILNYDLSISDFDGVRTLMGEQIVGASDYYRSQAEYHYNPDFNSRTIVGDNYNNPNERNYGSNDYEGPDAFHGTHVAGIIAANRDNDKGIKGVADNVQIMTIRAVPNGDERDKDVANAIYYAVNNGAQVINMSFGKGFSWDKNTVDKAVKYAVKHDVLLVHAAGNSSLNTDEKDNFPNDKYKKRGLFRKKKASSWLEVGALSWKKGEDLLATFSNYGKGQVDVFAPGVSIESTVPDQGYGKASGTSMASPVTAGVAAMLRSYFPRLSANQVKDIIMKSSISRPTLKVKKPGSEELVTMNEISVSGGIINAYNAVQMATKTKGKKKIKNSKNNNRS